jgi:subtilisin-like proprotein convertase family protein
VETERIALIAGITPRRPRRLRGLTGKIVIGALAATLAVTAGAPAIVGSLAKERHDGNHRQEQGVSNDARGKGKKKGGKTVTKTFSSIDPIDIPSVQAELDNGPADPYPSTISVGGFKKAKLVDVDLTLRGFSHEFPNDVDIMLVAPGGRSAVVMSDVGGSIPVGDLTLELDDQASATLPDEQELENGPFRPTNEFNNSEDTFPAPAPVAGDNVALSTFNGINPNGEWRLFIVDDGAGDAGNLSDGWSLTITAKSKGKKKR